MLTSLTSSLWLGEVSPVNLTLVELLLQLTILFEPCEPFAEGAYQLRTTLFRRLQRRI